MNPRELALAKKILDTLHDRGGLMAEVHVHAECVLRLGEKIALSEFASALDACNLRGWLTGVKNELTGKTKWKINDAGAAARLELRADE